ncbi:MAG: agmatinase, partial [Calditrichaceae bacterium]
DKFCHPEHSFFEIVPVPYEKTTSYGKGTSKGPKAIIEASAYVELYDEQYRLEAYKKGIVTNKPFDVTGTTEVVFKRLTQEFTRILKSNKFPIGLGGEHSITFPIYRAFNAYYNNLSVLHFDAHSDLRESYEGSIYSHASVMNRIAGLNTSITQIGVRSQCIEEAEFIEENEINTFYAHTVRRNGLNLSLLNGLQKNVYITFDLDFFDPSIMPSTGTPEPGGFQWAETIEFLYEVFKHKNVVGFDVVELAPQKTLPHPDFLAAKLVYKMMTLKILSK